MSILELKKKYNALIEREKKAETYLNKCTDVEFDKWYSLFDKLTRELSELMNKIPNITDTQVLEGFNDI